DRVEARLRRSLDRPEILVGHGENERFTSFSVRFKDSVFNHHFSPGCVSLWKTDLTMTRLRQVAVLRRTVLSSSTPALQGQGRQPALWPGAAAHTRHFIVCPAQVAPMAQP